MKIKVFILLLLLCSFSFLFCNEGLDYLEVNKDYYGINDFNEEIENNLFNTLYLPDGLYPLLKSLKNDSSKINELKKFIDKIDINTLIGNTIKDSLLLYVSPDINEDFLQLLKEYDKINNPGIKRIIELRENMQNYISTRFNFSTTPKRINFAFDISLILPNTDWKEINYQNNDRHSYLAGDDNYTGTVFISKGKILNNKIDTVKNIFIAKHEPFLFKHFPEGGFEKLKTDDMYKVKPGEIYLISENKKIGKYTFDKIYEQITINSNKYNFQTLVIRQRYYITKNILYVISIQSLMGGIHVLANKDELIRQHGFLLDTVIFE